MATRLPYYIGEDDIYSQLMAQFQSAVPYYSAAPVGTGILGAGMTGGYDPSLYATSVTRPQVLGGTSGRGLLYDGSGPSPASDMPNDWDNMTLDQKATYYAQNPGMAKVTQTLQEFFKYTVPGQIQQALVPDKVAAETLAAKGLQPSNYGYNESLGYFSLGNANVDQYVAATDTPGIFSAPVGGVGLHATPAGGIVGGLGLNPSATGLGLTAAGTNPNTFGYVAGSSSSGAPSAGPVSDIQTISDAEAAAQVAAEVNAALEAASNAAIADFGSYGENVAPSGAPAPGAPDGGYGSYAEVVGPTDGGGGGGGKIICTKLYHLGKMPEDIFVADQAFGALMAKQHPETYAGYALWARYVVRWMGREDWIGKAVVSIVHAIATPWSVAMAEEMGVKVKSGWFGRFLMKRGLQMCEFIGKMNQNRSLQNV